MDCACPLRDPKSLEPRVSTGLQGWPRVLYLVQTSTSVNFFHIKLYLGSTLEVFASQGPGISQCTLNLSWIKRHFSGLWLRGAARTSRQNSSHKQNSNYHLGPGKTEILLFLKRILEEIVPLERHLFAKCYSELMTSRVSRI